VIADSAQESGRSNPDLGFDPPSPPPGRSIPLRTVAVACGVPVLLLAMFIALYASGLIRDERRADYCAAYAPVSADLDLFDHLASALGQADPSVVLTAVTDLRGQLDDLVDRPSTKAITSSLAAMTDYLRQVELAARRHDAATLTDLAGQLDSFTADRQEFLRQSAEYCRYR